MIFILKGFWNIVQERSRDTEKGLLQNPSENNLRTSGETKISLEPGVRSESRDN